MFSCLYKRVEYIAYILFILRFHNVSVLFIL